MSSLTAVIGADTSGLKRSVEDAKKVLHDYANTAKDVAGQVQNGVNATNEQSQAYQRVIRQLEKVSSGTMTAAQKQKTLQSAVAELKIQWADLNEEGRASDFGQSVSATLSAAGQSLETLTTQIKQVQEEMGNMGGGNVKQQLKKYTTQLTELTQKYRDMSDAEKASAGGQELASKLSDLRAKAGELKDTVGDVNQEITALASDTPNLDVFNTALGLGADALSTYSSIIAKVTGNEEDLKNAISTVMAVQSAANMMTKITNALQSSSVIMLKVRAIQEKALSTAIAIRTAAEKRGTVATVAGTAAQKAFNLVAKANPYVLLATAVIGVGAALLYFTKKSNEATAAEKKHQEQLKREEEEWKAYREEVARNGASMMQTYQKLQTQWETLKTTHEKTQWIKDNKSEFDKLGVAIDDIGDAENFLVKNSDKVVQAFMLRAKAAAYAARAAKQWEQYLDKLTDVEKKKVKEGDEVPRWYQPSGVTRDRGGNTANGGRFKVNDALTITGFTAKGAEEYNKKLMQDAGLTEDALKSIEETTKMQVQLEQEAAKLLAGAGVKKTTKTTPTSKKDKKEKPDTGSVKALTDEISKQQAKLDATIDPEAQQRLRKQIADLTRKKNKIEFDLKYPKQSLAALDAAIQDKHLQIAYETDETKKKKAIEELKELVEKKREIKLTVEQPKKQLDLVNQELARTKALIGIEISANEKQRLQQNLDQIRASIKAKKAELVPELDPVARAKIQNELDQLEAEDRLISIQLDPNKKKALDDAIKRLTGQKQQLELMLKYPEDALKQVEEEIKRNKAELEIVHDPNDIVRINKALEELTEKKRVIEIIINYDNESIEALDKLISEKQALLKVATSPESRRQIQREIDELTHRKNEIEFDFKYPEGSIARLDAAISNKQAEYKVAIDDESRNRIRKELEALEQERRQIDLQVRPIVDKDTITDFERELEKHDTEMHVKVVQDAVQNKPTTKADRAQSNVDNLKAELEFNNSILEKYKQQYAELRMKRALNVQLTAEENAMLGVLDDAKTKTEALTNAFKEASDAAASIKLQSNFRKAVYEGVTGTIDALGNMNGAVAGTVNTWTSLGENWSDMTPFEKVTGGIDAVIGTLQNMIGIYESVNSIIELFSSISEAAAAKKVAASAMEGAAVQGEAMTETAATQQKIANQTAENASNMAGIASDSGKAIAGATKSGAALPFPANIAAIAAGIAAVVAAFAMIGSFADGGVINGATTIGDYNLARVNKGEMILNGSQQDHLFKLINDGVPIKGGNGYNGEVKFKIEHNALVGVLKNGSKKNSKI